MPLACRRDVTKPLTTPGTDPGVKTHLARSVHSTWPLRAEVDKPCFKAKLDSFTCATAGERDADVGKGLCTRQGKERVG